MKKSSISLKRKNANIILKSSCKFFKKNLEHETPLVFFSYRKMESIDVATFQNLSPANLMIKIWEFSKFIHHKPPPDPSSCNCQFYVRCCIEAARELWDNENYIFFDTALYRFQFLRKTYLCIISIKNEHYREYLVESILTDER